MKAFILVFMIALLTCCNGNDEEKHELCPENDRFCNEIGSLLWSDVSDTTMNWDNAVKYCEELKGRLPTIGELRSLIKECATTKVGGTCSVSDECLKQECYDNKDCEICEWDDSGKYSLLGDNHIFWSSSSVEDLDNSKWAIGFYNAGIKLTDKSADGAKVRCVKK